MKRLSSRTLGLLEPAIARPTYDRAELKAGVVHIGVGAFHRAHQAPVFESLVRAGDQGWGIVGASLRSTGVRDALAPQDYLYSLVIEENQGRSATVVGTILDLIVAPENPRRLIDAIAAPATRLVTITVTEKGYKIDPASGLLIEDEPQVRADLASLAPPLTMPGFLAAALQARRDRGLQPITIASCDNIAGNGDKLRGAVARIARAHDHGLGDWIEERCAFPNSMVDRIVPATRPEDVEATASLLGAVDFATVRTEPFSQWVIEDSLIGSAREIASAGVEVTSNLAPWEQVKLRMLNSAHSAMAYLGGLAGLETVDQFISQPWGEAFIQMLWDEVEPTLTIGAQLDLREYRRALIRRFANRSLAHRLEQIAMDGSQKIPQRLLGTAADLLQNGREPRCIALAIAGWTRWQTGTTDAGKKFKIDDPLASTTARLLQGANTVEDQVCALLSLSSVFPRRLSEDERFAALVLASARSLSRFGAKETLERFVRRMAELNGDRAIRAEL